jgi:ABC-type phosphate/phosphonate transport system ATPase subunit
MMGKELDGQSKIIKHLDERVEATDERVITNQNRAEKLLGKKKTKA